MELSVIRHRWAPGSANVSYYLGHSDGAPPLVIRCIEAALISDWSVLSVPDMFSSEEQALAEEEALHWSTSVILELMQGAAWPDLLRRAQLRFGELVRVLTLHVDLEPSIMRLAEVAVSGREASLDDFELAVRRSAQAAGQRIRDTHFGRDLRTVPELLAWRVCRIARALSSTDGLAALCQASVAQSSFERALGLTPRYALDTEAPSRIRPDLRSMKSRCELLLPWDHMPGQEAPWIGLPPPAERREIEAAYNSTLDCIIDDRVAVQFATRAVLRHSGGTFSFRVAPKSEMELCPDISSNLHYCAALLAARDPVLGIRDLFLSLIRSAVALAHRQVEWMVLPLRCYALEGGQLADALLHAERLMERVVLSPTSLSISDFLVAQHHGLGYPLPWTPLRPVSTEGPTSVAAEENWARLCIELTGLAEVLTWQSMPLERVMAIVDLFLAVGGDAASLGKAIVERISLSPRQSGSAG